MATLELEIDFDAAMNANLPDTAYGEEGYLAVDVVYVEEVKTLRSRSALKETLPAWLTAAQVNAAKLTMVAYTATNTTDVAAKLRRVTSDDGNGNWVEDEETWNRRRVGQNWTAAGGDTDAEGEVDWTLPADVGSFDITGLGDLVKDAINDRSGLSDFLIYLADEDPGSSIQLLIRSREYKTTAERAKLVIDYTPTARRLVGQVI